MSNLSELIVKLCPDGVVFSKLGDLFDISNVGVDKTINPNEKMVYLLNYMDVYKKARIGKKDISMKVSANDRKVKQCDIAYGDIFITPTSETIDDIGHSTVVIEDIPDAVYSYHIMRLRPKKCSIITSFFVSYLFRSDFLQSQIISNATGMTRFGLSKSKFESLRIPVPPLEVQQEIVRILDAFTTLEAELEAELEARKKQYEFYKNHYLDLKHLSSSDSVELLTLGNIANYRRGSFPQPYGEKKWYDGPNSMPFVQVADVALDGMMLNEVTKQRISKLAMSKSVFVPKDTVIVTLQGSIERVAITQYDSYVDRTLAIFESFKTSIDKRYFAYQLEKKFSIEKESARGSTLKTITKEEFTKFEIPVPSIKIQKEIVRVLDSFNAIANDILQGLPAEIAARRKQYEYYRNKLLTFKEVSNDPV